MAETVSEHDTTAEPTRRDFLYLTTAMAGVVGAAAVAWPFIDQMSPDASTLALASIEVDVSASSRACRSRSNGAASRSSSATAPKGNRGSQGRSACRSEGPDRPQRQSAAGCAGHRRRTARPAEGKENWLVMIGICTHLGCIPLGAVRRFRRLVLPLPRIGLRYGRAYPPRAGAAQTGRFRLYASPPTRPCGSADREEHQPMSGGHSTYSPQSGFMQVARCPPAAAAPGL